MLELRTKGAPLLITGTQLATVLGVRYEDVEGILSSICVTPFTLGKQPRYSLPEILHKLTFREDASRVISKAQRDKQSFDALPFSEQAAAIIDQGRTRAPRQKFMRQFIAAGKKN